MMPSRGMGAVAPSKMPKGKKTARKDDTDFVQYAEGGKTKSKVNEAGKQFVAQPKGIAKKTAGFR
jgi:hypothetical protein